MSDDILDNLFVEEAIKKAAQCKRGLIENPENPDPTTLEWESWVLSLFDESELINDNPRVHGLRRVAQLILGPIVRSGPTQVFPATTSDHPGRATVVFEITFYNGTTYSDVADCWHMNADDDFCVYTAAMASTRAEARALRKALNIKVAAAEELTKKDTAKLTQDMVRAASEATPTTGEYEDNKKVTTKQSGFIDTLCERSGIDRKKLLDVVFHLKEDKDGSGLTKRDASLIIDKLNDYIRENEVIPEEIKAR